MGHGDTEEDLVRVWTMVRVPIQERVPCGHHTSGRNPNRYLHFRLLSVTVISVLWRSRHEGEKFRSRRTRNEINVRYSVWIGSTQPRAGLAQRAGLNFLHILFHLFL